MAISAEWILNAAKQKIYAISHAKATIRGNSTVDADLTALEQNFTQFQSDFEQLEQDVENLDLSSVNSHISKQMNSATGVHGFRYYNDELQYTPDNGTSWITIETGGTSGGIAPADMKAVSVGLGADGTKLVIKGTDPDDSVDSQGTKIVKWAGTKVVRKVGSYPTKVSDGTLVVDYQTRNQYASSGFVDTGLVEGETYYYRWFPYSDQGAVNLSTDTTVNRASKKTQNYNVVGVTADWANNSYTRVGNAVGQSAGTFFDGYQMYGGRKRCIVADDKAVLAYYGDAAYTETGKLTKAVTKNGKTYAVGTSVQVMVIQPKFYYKVTPITSVANPNGTGYMIRKATYEIAEVQYEGFKVHPNFVRNGVEIPYMLQSAYEACTQDSSNNYITTNASLGNRLGSIAGAKPATGSDGSNTHSFTRAVARSLAAARGSGWQIGDMLTAACTQLLFMIEYCGMNSQTLLGQGNVSNTSSYAGVLATGGTASLGNASGNGGTDDGKHSVTYRGEENMWGNVWTWQDGGNGYNNNQGVLYWADHGFADDTSSSPYKSSGFNFARTNNYISAFGYSESCDFMFIPAEVSGDSANPVGDYFYQNYSSSSMTVAMLGGGCDGGSLAGLFRWGVYSASSNSGWYVGSRLACVPSADSTELEDAA